MRIKSRPTSPEIKTRLSIILARLTGRVMCLLPAWFAHRFVDHGGDLVFWLFPTYRRNVAANMARALGPGADEREINRRARHVFRNSARNFYDLVRVPYITTDDLRASVKMSEASERNLEMAARSERGALMVTAHYGAFDYVGQILQARGYKVTALTTRTVPEFIYAAVTYLRACRGFKVEEATPGGVRRTLMSLRRGEMIALLSDRDFFQNGVPVVFFGEETTLPPGPVRLARDTGALVIPLFAKRLRDGYELIVEPPFTIEKTGDADADARSGLQKVVAIYERFIREAPEQWVMFQRVWPERQPAAIRVFPIGSPLDGPILGPSGENIAPLTAPPLANEPEPVSGQKSVTKAPDMSAETELNEAGVGVKTPR